MVEFALVVTILVLLVFAVVDGARLYGTDEAITNAAHEGAKVAAEYYDSYSGNPSGLASFVKSQIVQEGVLNPNSIVNLQISTQDPSSPDYPGEQIVQVSFSYQFYFDGPWALIPGVTNPVSLGPVVAAEATR